MNSKMDIGNCKLFLQKRLLYIEVISKEIIAKFENVYIHTYIIIII